MSDENTLYFSELTFAPNAGRTEISPLSWDFKLGELWEQRIVRNTKHSPIEAQLSPSTVNKKK
ncbi:hypothetical protein MKU80_018640 [Providencia rettgeri]|nr:hypothetical protein [Providencia rettgeri]